MKSFSQSGLCSPSAAAAVHAVRLEVIYFPWCCPHLPPPPSLQPNPPLSNFPNKFKLNLEIKCAAKTNCMFGNNSGGFLKSSTKATHDWSLIRCRSRSATSWLVSLFFFSPWENQVGKVDATAAVRRASFAYIHLRLAFRKKAGSILKNAKSGG